MLKFYKSLNVFSGKNFYIYFSSLLGCILSVLVASLWGALSLSLVVSLISGFGLAILFSAGVFFLLWLLQKLDNEETQSTRGNYLFQPLLASGIGGAVGAALFVESIIVFRNRVDQAFIYCSCFFSLAFVTLLMLVFFAHLESRENQKLE